MQSMDVKEIIDDAFCEVTKKLVELELQKVCDKDGEQGEKVFFEQGYREAIEVHGCVNSIVVCQFSDDLFWYIIDTMNNGVTPPEEEIPLYLNEYINIACGYAVSKLNNLIGRPSRLSVPSFYQGNEPLEEKWMVQAGRYLAYSTEIGTLHIIFNYSLAE